MKRILMAVLLVAMAACGDDLGPETAQITLAGGSDATATDGGKLDGSVAGDTGSDTSPNNVDAGSEDAGSDTNNVDASSGDAGDVEDSSDTSGGSCKDRCGEFDKLAPCQCDDKCAQNDDCCEDYEKVCSTIVPDVLEDGGDSEEDVTIPDTTSPDAGSEDAGEDSSPLDADVGDVGSDSAADALQDADSATPTVDAGAQDAGGDTTLLDAGVGDAGSDSAEDALQDADSATSTIDAGAQDAGGDDVVDVVVPKDTAADTSIVDSSGNNDASSDAKGNDTNKLLDAGTGDAGNDSKQGDAGSKDAGQPDSGPKDAGGSDVSDVVLKDTAADTSTVDSSGNNDASSDAKGNDTNKPLDAGTGDAGIDSNNKGDAGPKDAGCTPACKGKQCGSDGCGGSCGTCKGNSICTAQGTCFCIPACKGKQCGGDGCGGSCGSCKAPKTCNSKQQCVCVPDCKGKQCGSDGCGGTCGSCKATQICNSKQQCVKDCKKVETCTDGIDNDCDGKTDTGDSDCKFKDVASVKIEATGSHDIKYQTIQGKNMGNQFWKLNPQELDIRGVDGWLAWWISAKEGTTKVTFTYLFGAGKMIYVEEGPSPPSIYKVTNPGWTTLPTGKSAKFSVDKGKTVLVVYLPAGGPSPN